MDLPDRRAATTRVVGTVALLAGLLTSLFTMANDSGKREPHVVAGLLVLAGVGLRIEAAIRAPRG